MQPEDYAHLYELEENFWWFVGMREITAALLDPFCQPANGKLVLDAGCGTGGMMDWLKRYSEGGAIAGIDQTSTALSFCHARGALVLCRASVTNLPFPDSTFDLVTSFDVLGHLPKSADELALREMQRVLKPEGIAFVRVAAYEWMKSSHDTALGTEHRYGLQELADKLKRSGFDILRATHANSLLMPVALLRRLVLKRVGLSSGGSDVKPLPAFLRRLNEPLTMALRAEARWLKRPQARLRFGVSAICVARKPTHPVALD